MIKTYSIFGDWLIIKNNTFCIFNSRCMVNWFFHSMQKLKFIYIWLEELQSLLLLLYILFILWFLFGCNIKFLLPITCLWRVCFKYFAFFILFFKHINHKKYDEKRNVWIYYLIIIVSTNKSLPKRMNFF